MPTSLFNSIASWILKKRIHQMELFMKYPEEVQNELLRELLKKAQKSFEKIDPKERELNRA